MSENNNELSDIVLNKNSSSGSSKKMILAIATLGIILVAVVTIMKSCGSESVSSAPQAVIPPQPQAQIATTDTLKDDESDEEPLFEEVEVVQDGSVDDADLDKIAQKLKEESAEETPTTQTENVTPTPKVEEVKPVVKPTTKPVKKVAPVKTATTGSYYIQVGSFTKYEPNKNFLASITKLGYKYRYHKVTVNSQSLNKVLVGPFTTEKEARDARRELRSKVEPGAFLVKL
ncbi:SPOR domain-containing protein [Sulfurimonas sp.]|uniref:SPOR domain-containing protein n=1 Tax=Sulfurimonas sp. TaxID=2022749 RepID=UPI003D0E5D5B